MADRLLLDVSFAARRPWAPRRAQFLRWAVAALSGERRGGARRAGGRRGGARRAVMEHAAALSVRVVGTARSRGLNRRYRQKDYATNVLSFGGAGLGPDGVRHLGELVICAPVVAREATAQGISREAHWAHMTVHGVLHLLGFDHERDGDARTMAAQETRILGSLGFSNPYS